MADTATSPRLQVLVGNQWRDVPGIRSCRLVTAQGFDTPCACGHMSSECTKREDGTCDG